MSVIQQLLRGRRVRVAGALDQVAVDCPDDMAAIYQQYWELVYRRCLATLGDAQAAEDATQDVFLLALSNFEQVQHDVVRELLDIARTISYERRRRPEREVSLDPPRHLNGGDDPAEIAERHGVLDEVWSGLSPVERRYVADKFAGFSFEEIAKRNRRKLGTVSSNLFRAREHARSLRGPTLPAALGVAGWRRITDLARRARNAAHSTSTAAAAQPVQTLTLSLTLAGLLAGVSPALDSSSSAPGRSSSGPSAVVPPTQRPDEASLGAASRAGGIAASAPGSPVAYAAAPAPASHGAGAALPLPAAASSETPEDTVIYTATPSPNYDRDHTILALGHGNTCACSVLLRSTDGGATWEARTGAPDGNQIVLPPAYPSDPRIFVGHAFGANGTSDWIAPSFDSNFVVLPVPAGSIALPAGFDSGDPRVLASTPSGVWSYDTATRVLEPLVLEPNHTAMPALATPTGSLDAGVFAMTSAQAVTPGTAARAASVSGHSTLWDCPPGAACSPSAEIPVGVGGNLAVAPNFAAAPALIAYSNTEAVESADGGHTFAPLPLQDGATGVDQVSLGAVGSSATLWIVAHRGTAIALEFAPTVGGGWHEVDHGLPQIISKAGHVVTLGGYRAMYLSGSGGFVCTNDGGARWTGRCPAA
jgi:DNA-directed RNA polymerase specialized sigma24 family protein